MNAQRLPVNPLDLFVLVWLELLFLPMQLMDASVPDAEGAALGE